MRYPELTDEERAALIAFYQYAGRTWKEQILRAWEHQSMPGIIASLRNSHGPEWLKSVSIKPLIERE